jgi:hypothetical protein
MGWSYRTVGRSQLLSNTCFFTATVNMRAEQLFARQSNGGWGRTVAARGPLDIPSHLAVIPDASVGCNCAAEEGGLGCIYACCAQAQFADFRNSSNSPRVYTSLRLEDG